MRVKSADTQVMIKIILLRWRASFTARSIRRERATNAISRDRYLARPKVMGGGEYA
jgi:hypothetical protein